MKFEKDEWDRREQVRHAFVRHFVPEGVEDGHDLLYDLQRPCHYAPSTGELRCCLRAYLDLLRAVPRDQAHEVLGMGMTAASELALAFVYRASRADRQMIAREIGQPLVEEIRFLLEGVERFREGMSWFDACKRLRCVMEVMLDPTDDNKARPSVRLIRLSGKPASS